MRKLFILTFFFSAFAGFAEQVPTDTTTSTDTTIYALALDDDPYTAALDSLISLDWFDQASTMDTLNMLVYNMDADTIVPTFSDEVYAKRIAKLNQLSPIQLDYNPEVRKYIEVYAQKRREQVSRMLGLAELYFPLFEAALDKYNLPLELKYLAIVESALNPRARSNVGAGGLWQFMYTTGKLYGLKVNSYVDDRNDPFKATEAACQYLAKLYDIFGDWNLALAAYNSGPGNVMKAIRRSGGQRNYWQIWPYLPRETRGYVPAFVAVNYIMNYSEEHRLIKTPAMMSFYETDTVHIKEQVTFDALSKLLEVPTPTLEHLNPAYRYNIIPKVEDQHYSLCLPKSKMSLFIQYEDSIYAFCNKQIATQAVEAPALVAQTDRVTHKVRRGESLGLIAERYKVSVSNIKSWNGLRGNTIRTGQKLVIYSKGSGPVASTNTASAKGDSQTYKVKRGDTFYSIARQFPGVSAENIMEWNNIRNPRKLRSGMKLKIYPKR